MLPKSLLNIIGLILLIPIFIFWLIYQLDGNYVHAWFWATLLGIGNLMLLCFSPNRKITEGIRQIGYLNWIFASAISLMPFIVPGTEKIFLRIVQSVCLFVSYIGYAVFSIKLRDYRKRAT